MALNLFIGYSKYAGTYYVNRHGQDAIDENAMKFSSLQGMLNHLSENYRKRDASIQISEEISEENTDEILEFIQNKKLKLTPKNLKERVA